MAEDLQTTATGGQGKLMRYALITVVVIVVAYFTLKLLR